MRKEAKAIMMMISVMTEREREREIRRTVFIFTFSQGSLLNIRTSVPPNLTFLRMVDDDEEEDEGVFRAERGRIHEPARELEPLA